MCGKNCKTENIYIPNDSFTLNQNGSLKETKFKFPKIVSKEILVWSHKSKWNLAKTGSKENKEL